MLQNGHDEIMETYLKFLDLIFEHLTIGKNSLVSIVNDILVLSAYGQPQPGIGNDG